MTERLEAPGDGAAFRPEVRARESATSQPEVPAREYQLRVPLVGRYGGLARFGAARLQSAKRLPALTFSPDHTVPQITWSMNPQD